MDSTQSTAGDVSSKQLPRARDQISQLVEQFRLDLTPISAGLNQLTLFALKMRNSQGFSLFHVQSVSRLSHLRSTSRICKTR